MVFSRLGLFWRLNRIELFSSCKLFTSGIMDDQDISYWLGFFEFNPTNYHARLQARELERERERDQSGGVAVPGQTLLLKDRISEQRAEPGKCGLLLPWAICERHVERSQRGIGLSRRQRRAGGPVGFVRQPGWRRRLGGNRNALEFRRQRICHGAEEGCGVGVLRGCYGCFDVCH